MQVIFTVESIHAPPHEELVAPSSPPFDSNAGEHGEGQIVNSDTLTATQTDAEIEQTMLVEVVATRASDFSESTSIGTAVVPELLPVAPVAGDAEGGAATDSSQLHASIGVEPGRMDTDLVQPSSQLPASDGSQHCTLPEQANAAQPSTAIIDLRSTEVVIATESPASPVAAPATPDASTEPTKKKRKMSVQVRPAATISTCCC